jgi:hypothetical protein
VRRLVVIGISAVLAVATVQAQQATLRPQDVAGCYELSPRVWSADTSSSLMELDTLGRVRPSWSKVFIPRPFPGWRIRGDTLVLLMTNGLSGWIVHVTRHGENWSGVGHTTTDVLDDENPYKPTYANFVARRVPCPSQPNGGW